MIFLWENIILWNFVLIIRFQKYFWFFFNGARAKKHLHVEHGLENSRELGGVVVLGSASLKIVNSNDANYMPAEKLRGNAARMYTKNEWKHFVIIIYFNEFFKSIIAKNTSDDIRWFGKHTMVIPFANCFVNYVIITQCDNHWIQNSFWNLFQNFNFN